MEQLEFPFVNEEKRKRLESSLFSAELNLLMAEQIKDFGVAIMAFAGGIDSSLLQGFLIGLSLR